MNNSKHPVFTVKKSHNPKSKPRPNLGLRDIVNTSALVYSHDIKSSNPNKITNSFEVDDKWSKELAYPIDNVYKVYNGAGMERVLASIKGGKQ